MDARELDYGSSHGCPVFRGTRGRCENLSDESCGLERKRPNELSKLGHAQTPYQLHRRRFNGVNCGRSFCSVDEVGTVVTLKYYTLVKTP